MSYAQAAKAPAWMDTLAGYLPALGHRNWIVVADSAFPLQISPGIETIVTGSQSERERVLKSFTSRGITVLPDGRKIEEVVL